MAFVKSKTDVKENQHVGQFLISEPFIQYKHNEGLSIPVISSVELFVQVKSL